jgi:Immunoglobulin-like domain of bacterial spore germination
VVYTSSFHWGAQEGVAAVYEANGSISDENYSAVLVKVLLDPEPGVALGPVSCPASINKPAYWASIIGLDTSTFSVGRLGCANMKGDPSLQILVPVYHTDGSQIVDVYVYDQITGAHPTQLFKLQGLYRGGAIISGYSTVLTSQVDPNSSANKGKSGDQLTVDLYREFKWSDGAGIFVPTAFPGIFPDLTRYQAELDQQAVAAGKDSWKNNAVQVAQRMAAQLLKWSPNAAASIVSGGGPQDVDAVVQVKSSKPGGMTINVTLSRLEGNTSNLWVVIGVTSGNGLLTITTPVKGDRLASPTTITGTGSAFEGVIGQAFVLDHLYTPIGQVLGASNGKTTYSTTITFTSSFQGGTQEGIVVVYMYSQADGSIATAAMQKVMLSA